MDVEYGVGAGGSTAARWWPWLFLAMYGVFFVVTGLNQLSMHTAQGKLVRPALRGRLMTTSILVGAPIAIGLAYLLLPVWLAAVPPRFDLVFGSAGLAFLVAAISTLLLAEPRRPFRSEQRRLSRSLRPRGKPFEGTGISAAWPRWHRCSAS